MQLANLNYDIKVTNYPLENILYKNTSGKMKIVKIFVKIYLKEAGLL